MAQGCCGNVKKSGILDPDFVELPPAEIMYIGSARRVIAGNNVVFNRNEWVEVCGNLAQKLSAQKIFIIKNDEENPEPPETIDLD